MSLDHLSSDHTPSARVTLCWLAGYIWLSTAGCRHWRLQPLHLLLAAFCKYWYGLLQCQICRDFVPKLWSADCKSDKPSLTKHFKLFTIERSFCVSFPKIQDKGATLSYNRKQDQHVDSETWKKWNSDKTFGWSSLYICHLQTHTHSVRRFSGFEDIEFFLYWLCSSLIFNINLFYDLYFIVFYWVRSSDIDI
jgi:hypothetical protein